MKISKEKYISIILFIFFIMIIFLFYKLTKPKDLFIETNIKNQTDFEIKEFDIDIKYKSNKYNNVKLIDKSLILPNESIIYKKSIDKNKIIDENLYEIIIRYKGKEKSIYYNGVKEPYNIKINITINTKEFNNIMVSGEIDDNIGKYEIKEVF